MKELSLYILDIAQNSLKAGAKNVKIELDIDHSKDLLTVIVDDDGCGMEKEFLQKVFDPFTTTRKERKVGLGLSLFKELAQQCGGDAKIESKKGIGTHVEGTFKISSVDLIPIGDIPSTIISLIISDSDVNISFVLKVDEKIFKFDTVEIKKVLDGVKISEPSVLKWLREYLIENLKCVMEV
ncbi:ATP-binding protein [Thermoanaerobacterium thermosaccharolyticum]|jgi:Histidine kinase-, DNA gyrase B-, and HSP90-like ATPase.|uniref:ATP-binding protein n=1 Tax=Thermoanaerobacterium thermosaccharolyticum TaxID=1517 RepID=UPI00279C55A2|nr:ATP-binding protein [Thermoanaerobacterium thermosaccharolyticum]